MHSFAVLKRGPTVVTYAYLWKGKQLVKVLLAVIKGVHHTSRESSTAAAVGARLLQLRSILCLGMGVSGAQGMEGCGGEGEVLGQLTARSLTENAVYRIWHMETCALCFASYSQQQKPESACC